MRPLRNDQEVISPPTEENRLMPWQLTQIWCDKEDGPNAFSRVVLSNQQIWDNDPQRADGAVCDALMSGGFGEDAIRRCVGNYEGQIMAIRRGYVKKENYGWRITDAGRQFLVGRGKCPPDFLWARDDWHRSSF